MTREEAIEYMKNVFSKFNKKKNNSSLISLDPHAKLNRELSTRRLSAIPFDHKDFYVSR